MYGGGGGALDEERRRGTVKELVVPAALIGCRKPFEAVQNRVFPDGFCPTRVAAWL